jgi:hypothetical protein
MWRFTKGSNEKLKVARFGSQKRLAAQLGDKLHEDILTGLNLFQISITVGGKGKPEQRGKNCDLEDEDHQGNPVFQGNGDQRRLEQ